jgi:hypothetical protein
LNFFVDFFNMRADNKLMKKIKSIYYKKENEPEIINLVNKLAMQKRRLPHDALREFLLEYLSAYLQEPATKDLGGQGGPKAPEKKFLSPSSMKPPSDESGGVLKTE